MKRGLRFFLLPVFSLFSTVLFATNYTFTGNGAWSNGANWKGGAIPHGAAVGDTIWIDGIATTASICDEYTCESDLPDNFGTLIIAAGASLTISNPTQFSSGGKIIIYGTLINHTTWEGYSTQNIIINGTFINRYSFGNFGTITVNEGGTIQNESGFGNYEDAYNGKGVITLNYGGTIKNLGTFAPGFLINNGGTIVNNGTVDAACNITGDFSLNNGTMSPGANVAYENPVMATFAISGDYGAAKTAVHNFKIGGAEARTYDALNVGGLVSLDGILNVSLVNGFVPTTVHDIPIINGTIQGRFSEVNLPSRYTLIYNTGSVVLRSLPLQPVTFLDFTVKRSGNTALLGWNVQNELNVLQYVVERSTDGSTYTNIGTVSATKTGTYGFTDAQPQTFNYYRIKCLHTDDLYRYSSAVAFVLASTVNTFNGEGSWSDASKWSNGTVPQTLATGEQLVINGTCTYDLFDFNYAGEIFIPKNSTLMLNQTADHKTVYYSYATFLVEGTLINRADYFESDGAIRVFGTFINESYFQNYSLSFSIEEGGKFINTTDNTVSSELTIKGDGAFINKGKIAGNATFSTSISNYGILAPGNSPGTVQVNGDYTAAPTAVHNFEVSGATSGAYDLLKATGTVNLDGALNVSLINGYVPGTSDEIKIMTGAVKGTFARVNLPPGYTLVYTATAVILKGVEALPVHFTSFDVRKNESGRLLNWQVGAEVNVQGYTVERRWDGGAFEAIGYAAAEGKSGYSFIDAAPLQGSAYYRIKSVDKDGAYAYSTVIKISPSNADAPLQAFPLPAHKNVITIQHRAATPNTVLRLIGLDGKVMQEIRPRAEVRQTKVDFSSLPSGLYFLRCDYGNGIVETIKVLN